MDSCKIRLCAHWQLRPSPERVEYIVFIYLRLIEILMTVGLEDIEWAVLESSEGSGRVPEADSRTDLSTFHYSSNTQLRNKEIFKSANTS